MSTYDYNPTALIQWNENVQTFLKPIEQDRLGDTYILLFQSTHHTTLDHVLVVVAPWKLSGLLTSHPVKRNVMPGLTATVLHLDTARVPWSEVAAVCSLYPDIRITRKINQRVRLYIWSEKKWKVSYVVITCSYMKSSTVSEFEMKTKDVPI